MAWFFFVNHIAPASRGARGADARSVGISPTVLVAR